jgi:hypothetical protein
MTRSGQLERIIIQLDTRVMPRRATDGYSQARCRFRQPFPSVGRCVCSRWGVLNGKASLEAGGVILMLLLASTDGCELGLY